MSKLTLYNKNFSSPAQITDESYNDLGASAVILGAVKRGFKGGADMVIRTASGGGGTLLVENTDYTLQGIDTGLTTEATFNVYSTVTITNVTFQTGTLYFIYKTTNSYIDADWANTLQESSSGVFSNAIINGDGGVAQRGTSFTAATTPANSDDTYLLDRWILLSDGNDVVDVSQSTDSPDGSKTSIKSLVATANKKWGFLQIIENENSMPYDNKTVSMGFQVKTTTAKLINNVRCAVLSWDSTADTVTSDVVSAWGASGADPTLVANWTYENTPANIVVTTSWVDDVSTVNVSIDTASMANMAVFIWVDDTDGAIGDELFLSQIRLNGGSIALPFQPRHYSDELALCKRYYEKTFPQATAPAQAAGTEGAATCAVGGGAHIEAAHWRYIVEKRAAPTIVTYNPNQANVNFRNNGNTADYTRAVTGFSGLGGVHIQTTVSVAGSTFGLIHVTADCEL